MRFFLDEDLSYKIAEIARGQGLDITTAREHGRLSYADADQLLLAAQDGRCVVTNNGGDYRRLTTEFMETGLPHAGVLILAASLAGNRFADVAAALARYDKMYPAGVPAHFPDYLHPP